LADALTEQVIHNVAPKGMAGERLHAYCNGSQVDGHKGGGMTSPWWCGKPTAMVHIGDLSYAVGYGSEWEEWMAQIQPYAARIPVMVQVGNHERNWDGFSPGVTGSDNRWMWGSLNSSSSGGECGIPTVKRFSMPGTWGERWADRVVGEWGAVDHTTGRLEDEVWYSPRANSMFDACSPINIDLI
jgi:hypothetical protein